MASLLRAQPLLECWCEGLGCGVSVSKSNAALSQTYLVLPRTASRAVAARRDGRSRERRVRCRSPLGGRSSRKHTLVTTPVAVHSGCSDHVPTQLSRQSSAQVRRRHWAAIVSQARALTKNISRSVAIALQGSIAIDDAYVRRVRRRIWTLFVGAAAAMIVCAGTLAVLPTPAGESMADEFH